MPDLFSLLSQAGQTLSAHSAAAATASNNLQNSNTPGYARQRAEIAATLPAEFAGAGYLGRGAELQAVSQSRDRFIEQQLPLAFGTQARSSAESDSLRTISVLDPDSSLGVPAALGNFYSSLRALAQNASDPSLRQSVVATSRQLALTFNNTAKAIESARTGIDADLSGVIQEVNRASASVAQLNTQITIARAQNAEPNDLLDARQAAVDTLAKLTGAVPVTTGTGDVLMSLPGGGALVSGDRYATMSVVPDGTNGGHMSVRMQPPDGSAPQGVASTGIGGRIGGLMDARDGALKDALTKLDTMAYDFAGAVNTAHEAGYALDGSSNHDLFVAGTVAGAATRIAVDPSIVADYRLIAASSSITTLPGDGSNLQRVITTENATLSSGTTPAITISGIIGGYGASAARAKAVADQDGSVLDNLTAMRESASGVSVDEELINLTKSQRAYEATMKVITTADQMLESLMNLR